MTAEASKLDRSLVFLATTGSSAPFIGLFGTVWGIMNSFIGLAGNKGVPSLEVVAPGIAEALIATAIGLAAAIPATVAYNLFCQQGKIYRSGNGEFLRRISEHGGEISQQITGSFAS